MGAQDVQAINNGKREQNSADNGLSRHVSDADCGLTNRLFCFFFMHLRFKFQLPKGCFSLHYRWVNAKAPP